MNLEQHDARDDMKVWLSGDEADRLMAACDSIQGRARIGLALRCGLRSHEVLDVAPTHVRDTDAGRMLRVWHGKGDQYRETPIPPDLAATLEAAGEYRGDEDSAIVDVTSTRSLRRTLSTIKDRMDVDDPEGWAHLSMHDLRRTWATQLQSADVDPMVVCDWGGWNDLETFLDHYRGTSTPEAQLRERSKVDWL